MSESDLIFKCQANSDEIKKKLREIKIQQQDDCSLLHLAAKYKRSQFCSFLIDEIKIGLFFFQLYLNICFLF